MSIIKRLLDGYKAFYEEYFVSDKETYKDLAERGQFPKALVIACSDSRVDPSIVTRAMPGEIFVVRNVANLVPPFQLDSAYHGTSAALEFAVQNLTVEHIIVLGHTRCAGIRALMNSGDTDTGEPGFIRPWVKIAEKARKTVLAKSKSLNDDQQAHLCEEEAIKISLQNLMTFPWIKAKVESGALALHGWHFDVASGLLYTFDSKTDAFSPVPVGDVSKLEKIG